MHLVNQSEYPGLRLKSKSNESWRVFNQIRRQNSVLASAAKLHEIQNCCYNTLISRLELGSRQLYYESDKLDNG